MNAARHPSDPVGLRAAKPPRQSRSQRSLERLLDATRELLEQRTFDEISVAEIVARAGSSVGVFYSRFADKLSLLDCLDELYAREVIEEFSGLAGGWRPRTLSLEQKIGEAARFLVRFHRPRRGLIRALVLHARLHVGGPFSERTRRMQSASGGIVPALLEHADEIAHRDPELAVRFSMVQALTTVREHVLFPEGPAATAPLDDAQLAREVARSWRAYLSGCAASVTGRPRAPKETR